MRFAKVVFFVLAFICLCSAKLELRKGVNQTVTFEGENLEIQLKKGSENAGLLVICFESTPDVSIEPCPQGFAMFSNSIDINGKNRVFEVDRQGRLTENSQPLVVAGAIKFTDDGALNILVEKLPGGASVILPHAEKWVPKKKVEAKEKKKSSSSTATMYISIACCVLVALILIAIGVAVYVFIIRKKWKSNPVPVVPPEEYQCEIRDETPEIVGVPTSPVIVEPEIRIHTPSQSPATPVTEGMAKGPNEKVPMPIVVAPPPPPKQKTEAVSKLAPPSPIPVAKAVAPFPEAVNAPSTPPSPVPPVNAKAPEPPAKPTSASTPKSKSPSRKHKSTALPQDKTQSATKRSPPTEGFGQDKTANALADNSKYNVRGYLPYSEASLPGSSRSKSRSRSRPLIVDEVVDTRLQTESYLCYAERMKLLGYHDHMLIAEHVDPEVQHAFSDAERALVKAAPADAPRFADAVVNEADKAIERFVEGRNLAWNEDFGFWDFVNTESTPASIGYIVIYRIASHIFKLKEVSMADTMVQTMPLMGLYILLLDKQFPTTFRVNLATELRSRASRIFKNVQRDQLKNAAFPATYMILAYDKNPKAFVKGEEIHSEAKKRKRRHHRHRH
uniref:Protein kinase domain-containing protein n=1 Tax=Panagrellus redivivus TaxID=6233 RepID=A0A7E4V9P3_PANRE